MRTSSTHSPRVDPDIPPINQDEPLDVLVITRTSLQLACLEALDIGDDHHPLSTKMILCDRLVADTPEAMLDAIATQVRKLRQKKMITDHTRILIKLPGNYENGKLLANARKNEVRLRVDALCSRIRKAGSKPWAGTIHVACDGASLAHKDFVSHSGATILHSGERPVGLKQREQTLSLLAEAWRENKERGNQKLDAAAEFRLVARFSGESSSLVAGNEVAVAKPQARVKSVDANERRVFAAPLPDDRNPDSLPQQLALARNHALAELQHGSAEKFSAALENNAQLLSDERFLNEARKYALGLNIEPDTNKKLGKLISRKVFEHEAGWKEALLLAACAKGDTDVAELLICKQGAHVDCRDASGATPLHLAARAGDEAMAALLLKYGADPRKTTKGLFGKTAARIARESGFPRVVQMIDTELRQDRLKRRGKSDEEIDVLFGNEQEKRIRAYLSRPDHHIDALEAYLSHGERYLKRPRLFLDGPAKLAHRRTLALKIAAATGNAFLMNILIDMGVKLDKPLSGGRTALHYAARAGDPAMVKLLLEQKADPALRSDGGSTALDYAIRSGSPEAVEALLAHGARVTRQHWFSKKTIARLADKGWLARAELRRLVITQLADYYKKFGDQRAVTVLADSLAPDTRLSTSEASLLRTMISDSPGAASARKLARMMGAASPDTSKELSTSSSASGKATDESGESSHQ